MIEFRTLPDDHPDLAHSPLLRAALLTLRYAQDHGSIGLTKTKAFKRVFVHWAVENFDWPGKSPDEEFRYSKVINEYEFPPLEVLHYLLIKLHLGRHFKGEFRLTKRGAALAQAPARLFAELIPFFVLKMDHASYARFEERPFGKWDVWMNVINVEADHGISEPELFAAFYGKEDAGWREVNVFSSSVLRPLEWAGLLAQTREDREGRHVYHVFKTPLWRGAMKLDTDSMLNLGPVVRLRDRPIAVDQTLQMLHSSILQCRRSARAQRNLSETAIADLAAVRPSASGLVALPQDRPTGQKAI